MGAVYRLPGGILFGTAELHLAFCFFCVGLLLSKFQCFGLFLAILEIANGAHVFPLTGVLFFDGLIGGLARAGIELFCPGVVFAVLNAVRLAQGVAVALLLDVHGPAGAVLRFAKVALFFLLAHGKLAAGSARVR